MNEVWRESSGLLLRVDLGRGVRVSDVDRLKASEDLREQAT